MKAPANFIQIYIRSGQTQISNGNTEHVHKANESSAWYLPTNALCHNYDNNSHTTLMKTAAEGKIFRPR